MAKQRFCASNLLWENIDSRRWGSQPSTLSDTDKLQIQVRHSFSTLDQFLVLTGGVIESLNDANVREILLYGASRRSGSIRRAVQRMLEIAPVDRIKPLSVDESSDLSDCVLLLYVHIFGVLDAFAIALVRNLNPVGFGEKSADLLSKKFRASLNLPELDRVFLECETWLTRVKVRLRNRYVHQIPPYIPTAGLTEEERERSQYLKEEGLRLRRAGDTVGAEKCRSEQEALGTFLPRIVFSEDGGPLPLHATVLDDVYRFVCLIYDAVPLILPILNGKSLEQ